MSNRSSMLRRMPHDTTQHITPGHMANTSLNMLFQILSGDTVCDNFDAKNFAYSVLRTFFPSVGQQKPKMTHDCVVNDSLICSFSSLNLCLLQLCRVPEGTKKRLFFSQKRENKRSIVCGHFKNTAAIWAQIAPAVSQRGTLQLLVQGDTFLPSVLFLVLDCVGNRVCLLVPGCVGNHVRLLVPDCVWNHLVSLRC